MLFHTFAANIHSWASNVFWFAFLLGILVLVHEFGHFAVAKMCGVYVETFSIGFGKRLFGFKIGDTDYRVSLLPLGGYVKFAGDNPGDAPTGKVGEFNSHPRWQRVLIALAGPVANGILAFACFFAVESAHHEVESYQHNAPVVDLVLQNTAADRAGMHTGDVITSFNGIPSPNWEQIDNSIIQNMNNIVVPLTVQRNGQNIPMMLRIDGGANPERFDLAQLGMLPQEQTTAIEVKELTQGLPAAAAGLQPGDKLLKIDSISVHSVPALLAYLKQQNGKPAVLTVERGAQVLPISVTPALSLDENGQMSYHIGFGAVDPPVTIEHLSVGAATSEAWKDTAKNSTMIVGILRGLLTRHVPLQSVSGPIGIFKITSEVSQMEGWWPKFKLMGVISLNLGIFNLLPIPILDGGVIVLLLIESMMRRDVNVEVKERIYQAAFVLLMVIFALVMFSDVSKMNLLHLKP
jgi:regulator of sigma E protease